MLRWWNVCLLMLRKLVNRLQRLHNPKLLVTVVVLVVRTSDSSCSMHCCDVVGNNVIRHFQQALPETFHSCPEIDVEYWNRDYVC